LVLNSFKGYLGLECRAEFSAGFLLFITEVYTSENY
jgi:hypothetical protein